MPRRRPRRPAQKTPRRSSTKKGSISGLKKEYAAIEDCLQRLRSDTRPEEREGLLIELANHYGAIGDFRQSLKVAEDWFREFPTDPLGVNPLKYGLAAAIAYKNLGNFSESRRHLENCLKAGQIENPDHQPRLAWAHTLLALLDVENKDSIEAWRHFDEAHALLRERTEQKADVYKHQAFLSSEENRWEESQKFLDRAEEIYRERRFLEGLASVALERGNLAFRSRPLQEIETAYANALKVGVRQKDKYLEARAHHNLGVLACRRGDFSPAFKELEKARKLFSTLGDEKAKGLNLLQLAIAAASIGDFEASDRHFSHAVVLAHASSYERFEEVSYEIETLKRGFAPQDRPPPSGLELKPQPWDLEYRWLSLMIQGADGSSEEIRAILSEMHQRLPQKLKAGFAERPDYRRFSLSQAVRKKASSGRNTRSARR